MREFSRHVPDANGSTAVIKPVKKKLGILITNWNANTFKDKKCRKTWKRLLIRRENKWRERWNLQDQSWNIWVLLKIYPWVEIRNLVSMYWCSQPLWMTWTTHMKPVKKHFQHSWKLPQFEDVKVLIFQMSRLMCEMSGCYSIKLPT